LKMKRALRGWTTLKTKREIVEKRRKLFHLAEKYNLFKKGDKRVHTPRLCVVCSRPLSSLILHENRYVVSHPHFHIHLNDFFIVDICENVNSCYRTLRQKGELEDVHVRKHSE
jgi:hypothetical protein